MINPNQYSAAQQILQSHGVAPATGPGTPASGSNWYSTVTGTSPTAPNQQPANVNTPAPSLGSEFSSLVNNTKNAALAGGDTMVKGAQEGADVLSKPDNGSLGAKLVKGARLAGTGIDTGLGAIQTLFSPVSGAIQTLSDNASDNVHVQNFAKAIGPALDKANQITQFLHQEAQKNPELAKNLSRAISLATLGEGEAKLPDAADAAKGVGKKIVDAAATGVEGVGNVMQESVNAAGGAADAAGKATKKAQINLTKGNKMPALEESANRIQSAANVSKANTERTDAAGNPMRQGVGNTTVESPSKTYSDYYTKTRDALTDTKKDNAIQDLGSKIGDLFKNVVGQRKAAGKELAQKLTDVKDNPVDISETRDTLDRDLTDNKVAYNAKTGEIINTGNQTKFTNADKTLMEKYVTQLHSLGDKPTVEDLDAFVSRIPREIKELKSSQGIKFKTNAERIIGNNLNKIRAEFKQFPEYNAARQKFADLAKFTTDHAAKLGKMTPSGDFAKDASLAKRSVQSVMDNGSKDFLLDLEKRTGFPIVDHAVLALQAMKDAGDYRGASLLENTMQKALNEGKIPTKVTDMVNTAVGHAIKKGAEAFTGTPYEQTLRYLQDLEKRAKK